MIQLDAGRGGAWTGQGRAGLFIWWSCLLPVPSQPAKRALHSVLWVLRGMGAMECGSRRWSERCSRGDTRPPGPAARNKHSTSRAGSTRSSGQSRIVFKGTQFLVCLYCLSALQPQGRQSRNTRRRYRLAYLAGVVLSSA